MPIIEYVSTSASVQGGITTGVIATLATPVIGLPILSPVNVPAGGSGGSNGAAQHSKIISTSYGEVVSVKVQIPKAFK